MRHAIANILYRIAAVIDREVVRWDYGGISGRPQADIGDSYVAHHRGTGDFTSTTVQLHLRDETPVSANFGPGEYTYSALKIGRGVDLTLFVTRRSVRRLVDVLDALEAQYRRVGENRINE